MPTVQLSTPVRAPVRPWLAAGPLRGARLACAALLLGLAACDSSSEPPAVLSVTIETETPRAAFMPDFSAARTSGVVLVRGVFQTTCQPHELKAAATMVRRDLTVTVTEEHGAMCVQTQRAVTYDVRVTGADRADFVAVKHESPGLAAVTVFDATL
jgi:hypothetical protein